MNADEQAQLVLPFDWDTVDRISQEERRLSEGDVPAVRWPSPKDTEDEDIHRTFPGAGGDLSQQVRRRLISTLRSAFACPRPSPVTCRGAGRPKDPKTETSVLTEVPWREGQRSAGRPTIGGSCFRIQSGEHERGRSELCMVQHGGSGLGGGGIRAGGALSLNALLKVRQESQDALEERGGALMDVDESTPAEVSELMAKVKFVSDCILLKVCGLGNGPEHARSVALGQLSKAENQYGEAAQQLDDLPDAATAEDKDKIQRSTACGSR